MNVCPVMPRRRQLLGAPLVPGPIYIYMALYIYICLSGERASLSPLSQSHGVPLLFDRLWVLAVLSEGTAKRSIVPSSEVGPLATRAPLVHIEELAASS